jgi:hypothetical protein
MDKNTVTDRNGGELVEHRLRELTKDETALVGGGVLDIFKRPNWTFSIPGSVHDWWDNLVGPCHLCHPSTY